MEEVFQPFLRAAVIVFMAASLFEAGLRVELESAWAALGDWRFMVVSLLWAFAVCPALAVALVRVVPLDPAHATGLLLLAMAPGAPFLPAMAAQAGGDLPHVAAFMLIASVGTVLFMPLAVPLIVSGVAVDARAIATPLVVFVILPLAAGVARRAAASGVAHWIQPAVGIVAAVATLQVIALVTVIYAAEFAGAVGSFAIATLVGFLALATAGAYRLSLALPEPQKRVLALGLCTRNVGAAAAPLLAAGIDSQAMVMVALAVPATILSARLVSRWVSRHDVRRYA
jgi:BASS family bile acid:Na+ symporter